MKSRASFYNIGVGKNLFKRCWPIWAGYFALLLFGLPLEVYGQNYQNWSDPLSINRAILQSGTSLVLWSFIASMIVVMAMFSYLYNSRGCGMMNSLPIRRETMFWTVCLTGLAPMLIADLLVFAITAIACAGNAYIKFKYLVMWLELTVLGNTAFYGMAVFCAMLTGNIVILPAVYVVLNLTAVVLESGVTEILKLLVYGYLGSEGTNVFFLSPIAKLYADMSVRQVFTDAAEGATILTSNGYGSNAVPGEYYVQGFKWLVIYFVLGLILMGAAMLLYRRRRMETAGDTVAVKVLKPIFKYCMCFGTAVVFATLVNEEVYPTTSFGSMSGVFTIVMLMLGGVIGYYVGEMMIHRSLRVFKGNVKGCAVGVAVIAAFGVLCELNVTGFETRVPDIDDVESAFVIPAQFDERENIEAVTALHRQLIADKKQLENLGRTESRRIIIKYAMKNGRMLNRVYEVDISDAALAAPGSEAARIVDIMNTLEARRQRTGINIPLEREKMFGCSIDAELLLPSNEVTSKNVSLSADEAWELYTQCIIPDAEDGCLGEWYMKSNEEYFQRMSNIHVYFTYHSSDVKLMGPTEDLASRGYEIQMNSARCIKWIEEHTGLEACPRSDYALYPKAAAPHAAVY